MKALVLATALAANLVSVAHADQNPFIRPSTLCYSGLAITLVASPTTIFSVSGSIRNSKLVTDQNLNLEATKDKIKGLEDNLLLKKHLKTALDSYIVNNNNNEVHLVQQQLERLDEESSSLVSDLVADSVIK